VDRREALRWLVAAAGSRWLDGPGPDRLLAWGRYVHTRAQRPGEPATRALDAHANRTVIALAERIIPVTDTPGATDARVGLFIDRMLADWHSAEERARVLDGLTELDARSRARYGRAFVDCSEPEQHGLLVVIDEEVAELRATPPDQRPGTPADPDDHWFATLKFLTVWGYCTSEVAQRQTLGAFPLPGRYDGCAPYPVRPAGDA